MYESPARKLHIYHQKKKTLGGWEMCPGFSLECISLHIYGTHAPSSTSAYHHGCPQINHGFVLHPS